jgi:hypothetical protein
MVIPTLFPTRQLAFPRIRPSHLNMHRSQNRLSGMDRQQKLTVDMQSDLSLVPIIAIHET